MPLSVKDLAGGYDGQDVFAGVGFDLDDGETALITGPNGAGKSTLLKCLFGLVPVRRGAVSLDGADITHRPAWMRLNPKTPQRSMGLVLQGRRIFGTLSVEENLVAGANVIRSCDRRSRIAAVWESFPRLARLRHQPARLLSGGEQQILVIARTLLTEPAVLLLDEPTLGLDDLAREGVWSILRDLKQRGLILILVEHDDRRAAKESDRYFRMDADRPFCDMPRARTI